MEAELRRAYVGVVGSGTPEPAREREAEELGRCLADSGAVIVCGGLGGVMAAACRGAVSAGGTSIGILPGTDRKEANRWVSLAIPTGLGELRNGLVVRASDVLVAVGGGYGTLSEVAFALRTGTPVVGLGTWDLRPPDGVSDRALSEGIVLAEDPMGAATLATSLASAQEGIPDE